MNAAELSRIKSSRESEPKNWIRVGYSTCGIAAGAEEVYAVLEREIRKRELDVTLKKVGCVGMCYAEPLVEVDVEGAPRVFYGKVDGEKAAKIVEKHVVGKILLNDIIYDVPLR
ncbi:MAG TPA: (2Fe-2S) ferredoxin domain-containing protein [bacterium]|nr:(2Fe-2S) ferredoxin domain-containing protein [bacterium]HPJ72193.1 (2Fe-2S) ferredoxin domain-containing protein [bacterium]HPQ65521.1 (2Fe-2S) ferredoxin domain-containing protein [bacterium]